MLADETRDSAEKAAEKSSEKATDSSPIKADDVMSAHSEAAEKYKADLARRAEEYTLGKERDTGSHKWLPNSLEIVDGFKKLVGKITRAITGQEKLPDEKTLANATAVKTPENAEIAADVQHRGQALESGTKEMLDGKPESWSVIRDDQNRPSAIYYPDGKSNRIEYDNDGYPTVLHARDGSTIVRDGDYWNITKDGKTARWDGKIQVSENADITLTRHDGRAKVRHADGSETVIEPRDAGPTSDHSVTANDKAAAGDHAVTANDKPAAGDHSVTAYDKPAAGDHSVTANDKAAAGDHSVTANDKAAAGDQGTVKVNPDGSEITTKDGHVTHTKDAKGHERSFEYAQGHLMKVIDHGTATWQTKDGIHWISHDGRTWEGTITVGQDGTYQYKDSKGNLTIEKTDGTSITKPGDATATALTPGEHKNADGSSLTVDDQGHVIKTVDANGKFHEFKYGTITGPDGKQTTSIVEVKDAYGVWTTKNGTKWEKEKDGSVEQWKGTINVSNKGDYIYQDGKGVHIEQLDGKKVLMHADGHTSVQNKDGHLEKVIPPPPAKATTLEWNQDHVSKIVYPDGKERKFEYNDLGELNKVTEPDGTVWSTKDSATAQDKADPMSAIGFHKDHVQTWTSSDGKTWTGNISVDEKGNYKYVDAGGTVTVKSTDGKATCTNSWDQSVTVTDADGKTVEVRPPVDRHEMEKLAEQLHKQSGADALVKSLSHTDRDLVLNQLSGLTEAKRAVLRDVYIKKYGKTLASEFDFLSGSDKTKFLSALYKKDGDVSELSYDRIKAAIETSHEVSGDSQAECEKKIRNTLAVMNSDDIQQMLKDHPNLRDLIMNDGDLSKGTKQICDMLLKGKDRLSDDDYFKMANIAITEKNLDAFQEVMALASPEARKRFLDDGGNQKIKDAFGESTLHKIGKWALIANPLTTLAGAALFITDNSSKDVAHAQDYAKEGKLSATQQIIDNTGLFFNNTKGIENALNDMTPDERKAYMRGKELADKGLEPKTDEDKTAKEYYDKLHGALNKINMYTHDADMARWEDLIATKGGGLIAKIGAHRGSVYNDSKGDVIKDIENMPKEEWERLHNLKLGKNADGSEPKNAEEKKHNLEQYKQYHDELEKALNGLTAWVDKAGRFKQEDADRALDIFEKKMEATDFAASQEIRRSLEEAIKDDTHWYKNDRQALAQNIAHMTSAEQEKYRTDPEFKKKIDDAVKSAMSMGPTDINCPALKAAQHMLQNITDGKTIVKDKDGKQVLDKDGKVQYKSPEDIISKLGMRAQDKLEGKITEAAIGVVALPAVGVVGGVAVISDAASGGKAKDALFASGNADPLRDIQQAFRDDPDLRNRILHPKTDADNQLAAQFKEAATAAMGDAAYGTYVQPLLEKGFVPMEVQAQLNEGIISNDKEGALKDVSNIAQLAIKEKTEAKKGAEAKGQKFDEKNFHGPATDELNKILNDKDYQKKALGFLSDDDRDVAIAVLKNPDGKIHPEDSLKLKLNHVGGSDEIMAILRKVPHAELDRLRSEYYRKYGNILETDLLRKCTSSDHTTEIKNMFAKYSSATDAYFNYMDDVCKSKSGFGAWFTEHVGHSGTGYQLDNVMNQYTKELAEAHGKFKELPPAKQAELQEKLTEALKNWKESKGATAEYTVDAVIAVIAVAGAAYTGGSSLGLLALIVGGAGAVSNVAIKQAMLGGDYDWDPASVAKDILTGTVNGVANVLGPGEAAALFKVGSKAATVAAEQTVKQLGELALKEGGEKLLKEGAEKALQKGMQDMMGNAIAHGAKDFSEAEITKLAEKAVAKELTGEAKGQAIKQIEQTIKKNMEEQLKKETANFLKQTILEAQLNMAGGAMGGGAGGFTTGVFQWDGTKTVQDNLKALALSTTSNAAMGAVFAGLMSMGIKGGKEVYDEVKPLFKKGTPEVVIAGKEVPIGNITGPEGHVTTVEGTAFGTTGKGDVAVMNTGTNKTTIIDSVGNVTELKPGETVPLKQGDTVLVGEPPHKVELHEGPPTIPAPPPEVHPSLGPEGESIKLGAKEYGVKYSSGDSVLLEKVSQPLPAESAHPISAQQLKEDYVRIGDSNYYYKKSQDGLPAGDKQIYKIDVTESGGMKIHEDPNMQLMQKDQFLKKSGGKSPEDFPPPEEIGKGKPAEPGKPDQPTKPGDQPVKPGEQPGGQPKPSDTAHFKDKDTFVTGDGKEIKLTKEGAYYIHSKDGLTIKAGDADPIKGHVLASSPEELNKTLQIVLPELEALRNAGLIDYKIINPGDPGALTIGKGQGQKGITIYAKDPEKLNEALKIIDQKLTQHSSELPPIHPEGLDQVTGKSGRVALVRDTFDPGRNPDGDCIGALLEPQLAAKIHADKSLPHADGKITTEGLQLVEQKAGLMPGSLTYDADGNLMIKSYSTSSKPQVAENGSMKSYLAEAGAESHPFGQEYIDPATGKKVVSQGLSDRPAMYELSKKYGVDPLTGADVPAPAPDVTPKLSDKPPATDLPPASKKASEGLDDLPPETQKTGASGDKSKPGEKPEIHNTADGGTEVILGDSKLNKPPGEGKIGDVIEYKTGDGPAVKLQLREDGWYHYYPPDGTPLDGQAVKLHVFAANAEEAGKLQKIVIEELQKDPTIAWKTMDPQIGMDPKYAAQMGKLGGDGKTLTPFTIYAKNPEDAAMLQQKMKHILEEHKGELHLDNPIHPNAPDKLDPSGRIGIVRDFYSPAADLGTEAKVAPELQKDFERVFKLKEGEHLTQAQMNKVEADLGMKLHYDDAGNLMVKETGAKLDVDLANRINAEYGQKFGLVPGQKFTPQQLEEIARDCGIDPKILVYDSQGNLVLKGTPGQSKPAYGKYFLTPGGLEPPTDANAYYALCKKFGIDPVDIVTFKPGEHALVKGKEVVVIGREGDDILVRPADAKAPDGQGIPVNEQELKSYHKVGEGGYYEKDGVYYKLSDDGKGGKSLVEDWDVTSQKPDEVILTKPSDAPSPGINKPVQPVEKPATALDQPVPSEQPPKTNNSADSQSGVNEVFDKAGIKSEDRPAVLDQIHKDNPLASPEVREPYVQSMRDLTSRWDDLNKLAQDADGIDKRYFDLRPKSEKTLHQLVESGLSEQTAAQLLRNPEKLPALAKSDLKLAELLAHSPEQAQILNDFAKAAAERKQINVIIQERAAELQKVMDQLADLQKPPLPHTKILIGDDSLVPPGKTNYADGVIAINRKDILANNDPAKFTEQLYHEFVHSEQDNLIIRNLTDELEKKVGHPVGQPPTAEELRELAKVYEAKVGTPPDEFHLMQALDKRNGEHLTPEQAKRANELAEAFKNNQPPGPRGEIVKKDLESCTDELRKLGSSDNPAAGKELIDKLSQDNASLTKSLFGEQMPAEVEQLLQKYKATGQVAEQEARDVLQKSIRNHKLALDGELAEMRKAYYGPKHELEAWVIGKEAKTEFEKAPLPDDHHLPVEPSPETNKTGNQPPKSKETGEAPEVGKKPTEAPPENQPKLPKEAAEDKMMNWAEIPEEKRLEMVQRAKRSELYKPEVVDDFVSQSKELTSQWGDESHVSQNFVTSHRQLVGAYGSFEHGVQEPLAVALEKMGKSREEIQKLVNSTDEVRKLLNDEEVRKLLGSEEIRKAFPHAPGPEEQLKLVNDYIKARDAFGEAQALKDHVVKERTDQIQKLYDRFADEHGLPRVKVTLKDEVGAAGTYSPGKGEIHINEAAVLSNKDPAKLADTMLHEFAHNEQDFIKIRYLAEELSLKEPVGYPPSAHAIDQLQLDYEIRTGGRLDPKYLDEVLRVNEINRLEGMYAKETGHKLSREQAEQLLHLSHDQQILKLQEFSQGKMSKQQAESILDPKQRIAMTEAEKARANEMLDDAMKYPWPGDTVAKYHEDNAVATSVLRRLDADPEAYVEVLQDLAQDQKLPPDQRVLTHRLFGSDNPPEDVLSMLDAGKTWPWDPNRVLKESIHYEVDNREAWMKEAWREYFANPDEQEAWLIGKRAAIASREVGVPGSDLPPETIKDLDPHPERKR